MLINRCFDIGSHIATICSTNISLGVPQYKKYQKQEHTTFACHIHRAKYLKCNSPHKLKHHHDLAQCCKSNFKISSPRLKTLEVSHVHICSNILIAKMSTRQTVIIVCSENIISTVTSITKNLKNFKKLKLIQFAYLWITVKHDFKKSQYLLTGYSKELFSNRYHFKKY